MPYTLGQASKATGLHKTRLSRAIKNGVISATKTPQGGYLIDPAELHRVFPPVTMRLSQDPVADRHMGEGVTPLLLRLKEVETRLEEAQHRISDKEDVIRDLRQRLDESTQERQRLTLLVTHQAERQPPPPKGFWAWLFG
jgi:hypothetical protein